MSTQGKRFVVVEGLIGAGKTSLCRLLAARWGASLVLEPAADNPFLAPYYDDPQRYAFPVQMFYLVTRWRQQDAIRQQDLFADLVVSDYLWQKDRLFAELTLPPAELELYDRFASALGEKAPCPDLVIWLQAPTEVLLQRIARRAIPAERAIDADYLEKLREGYRRLWASWSHCPILVLDNRDMNYVDDPAGQQAVLEKVQAALSGNTASNSPGSPADREDAPSLFGTEA